METRVKIVIAGNHEQLMHDINLFLKTGVWDTYKGKEFYTPVHLVDIEYRHLMCEGLPFYSAMIIYYYNKEEYQ